MDPSTMPTVSAGTLPYNSLQSGTVVAFGITFFLSTLFLAARWLQTVKLVKWVECDVVILTMSWAIALAYFLTMVDLMDHGWARHANELSLEDYVEFNKRLLANTILYLIVPSMTKLGMLTVLFRINANVIYRTFIVIIAVCIIAYTVTLGAITGGPCNPMKPDTTSCLMDVATTQSALNIISDLAVIAVPIPMINGLNLNFRQKFSVGCMFALGSGVIICSIARLPYVLRLESSPDITYQEGILGVWSIVEVNLAIICACAMRLKKLFVHYWPRLGLGSSFRHGGRGQSGRSGGSNMNQYQVSSGKGAVVKTTQTDVESSCCQGAYHLHSIQKSSALPVTDVRPVEYSYNISCEGDKRSRSSDGGSEDKIIV